MESQFGKTFLFLTKLAWNSRITLPMIISAVFMAMDFRMQVEINVHTEGIMLNEDYMDDDDDGLDDNGDDLTLNDTDSWQTLDTDDDDDDDNGNDDVDNDNGIVGGGNDNQFRIEIERLLLQ